MVGIWAKRTGTALARMGTVSLSGRADGERVGGVSVSYELLFPPSCSFFTEAFSLPSLP